MTKELCSYCNQPKLTMKISERGVKSYKNICSGCLVEKTKDKKIKVKARESMLTYSHLEASHG